MNESQRGGGFEQTRLLQTASGPILPRQDRRAGMGTCASCMLSHVLYLNLALLALFEQSPDGVPAPLSSIPPPNLCGG